jgi:tRNA(Ile)-lysidine synthase
VLENYIDDGAVDGGAVDDGAVDEAVARATAGRRLVLAVSGGADSMALLDAVARVARDRIAAVATFDHGTGRAAALAVEMVQDASEARGIPVVVGRASSLAPTEAAWRAARWEFLRAQGVRYDAQVATGHTRSDQVETIIIRLLRDSGPRGLAALYADSDIVRPLLDLSAETVDRYVRARDLRYVEDPSNDSPAYLRNRVRLDLLPALQRIRPDFDGELLGLAGKAAAWRRELDHLLEACCPMRATVDGMSVAVADLAGYDPDTLAVVWPALAARAGVRLDRRGTSRLTAFTFTSKVGGTIQLSGRVEVVRSRFLFVFRQAPWSAHRPR